MFRINLCFICLVFALQFSGCSAFQPTVSSDSTRENNLASPTPPKFPRNDEGEYFKKQWEEKYQATVDELERNRQLWQKSNIVNYDFVCWQKAFGMNGWGEALIKVRESKNISIEKAEKDSPAKIDGYEKFATIGEMFDYLREQLDDGRLLKVKYNAKFGYPEDFWITFSSAIDAASGAEIQKFEIVN